MQHNHTNWRPDMGLEEVNGYETWTHTAPHQINEAEVDGDIDLSDIIDDEDDE